MLKQEKYPLLEIRTNAIAENARIIVSKCAESGIRVAGVFKGVNGLEMIAEAMEEAGCSEIASSRIEQLIAYKRNHPQTKTLLLRLPMACELKEVIMGADISLNSERQTLLDLELLCKKMHKQHSVILMMDLGDLREGCFDENELTDMALWVERELNHIHLAGIGVNLGCYGSIKPTVENLNQLVKVAQKIEAQIERPLEYISGGATSTLPLVYSGKVPSAINHLRIGEGILLNMDLPIYWDVDYPGLSQETFILKAQIIEIKDKPSYPVGEIFIDAFGHTPEYEDKGIQKRALVALGKQDFAMEDKLFPQNPEIKIIGSSSDHLIIDLTACSQVYRVGDAVSFRVFYGPMLHLCTNPTIQKRAVAW